MSGVPPKPLTSSRHSLPAGGARSSRIALSISSAIASAEPSLLRHRPGSPWMPTPTSISSGPSENVGLPAAGTVHGVNAIPNEPVRSFTSRPRSRKSSSAGDASPAGRPGRVGNGDVVVGHHRFHLSVAGHGQFGCHLKVHNVAFVVL